MGVPSRPGVASAGHCLRPLRLGQPGRYTLLHARALPGGSTGFKHCSGLSRIRPLIQGFRARGGTARILLGIDEGGASVEGLYAAIGDFDEKFVLNDAGSGTFHPKLYIFSGEAVSIIVIGSSNLTRGGLFANYEAGVCLELDLTQHSDAQMHEAVTSYVQRLWQDGTSKPLTEDLVQNLIDDSRYDIRPEASHPGSTSVPDGSDVVPLLFGTSQHAKNQDPSPVPAGASEPPVSSHDTNGTKNGASPHLDASKADRVRKVWRGRLPSQRVH